MITQDNIATGVLYNDFSPLQVGLTVGVGASIVIGAAQGIWAGGQSADFGGQTMTLISFQSNSFFANLAVFYLLNPPNGNQTLNIYTGSSGNIMSGVAASYFGAGGIRVASTDKGSNAGLVYSLSPTSSIDDLVIHAIGSQESPGALPLTLNLTYATGETQRAFQMVNQSRQGQINYADKAGANGTTTVSFQTSFSDANTHYETIAFALVPSTLSTGMIMVSD